MCLLVLINAAVSTSFVLTVPDTSINVTFCDFGIFLGAFIYGSWGGGVVGGISGLLIVFFHGNLSFMIPSMIIHSVEGIFVGKIASNSNDEGGTLYIAVVTGVIIMVLGYFVADSLLLTHTVAYRNITDNVTGGIINAIGLLLISPLIQAYRQTNY